jgi:hypothetical protein
MQRVSRQRIVKDVPAAMNTHTTIELLLETVFSVRSVQSVLIRKTMGLPNYLLVVSCQLIERVESVPMKRRLYVCCSYSETVIITMLISVARIRLVKNEKA